MTIRLAIAIVVAAGVFAVMGMPTFHELVPPTPAAEQRVVYVAPDYALHSVRSDGSQRERLTESGLGGGVLAQPLPQQVVAPRFTWPTWSPDGRQLVASQTAGLDRQWRAALALLTPPSLEPTHLQTTGNVPLTSVADGAPHYAQWSPDGRRLSLIAPNAEGTALALNVVDPVNGDTSDAIVTTAPIYHTWSPDGRRIAIHHREALLVWEEDGTLNNLGTDSRRYRTPSFSSDSATLAYMEDDGLDGRLAVRDLETGDERTFMETVGSMAFAFSPADRNILAVAVTPGAGATGYDQLLLLDTDKGTERSLYEGRTYAFWWSPDGTKLAVVGAGVSSFTWEVIDAATGERRTVAEFFPTQDFITYIQFFDQFALSHQLWSEDSTAITFAGEVRSDAQPDAADHAWVLDVSGEAEPRSLGPALQAYFAPSGKELTRE